MKMNKIFVATTILATSSIASADVIGIYAGAQNWNYDIDGYVSSGSGNVDFNDDLGYKDSDDNSYFVALEHPVPVIPNIKIQQNNLEGSARGTASQNYTFGSVPFVAGTPTVSNYDFSNTDYTLYYEILDNWVNLDLGITGKQFDGFVDVGVEVTTGGPIVSRVDFKGTVPMLYGKAQFDLPLTGFSVGSTANLGQFGDDKINDYTMYFGYGTNDMGFGFELGYRNFTVEFDQFDDLSTDFTFDGYYASVNFHF